MDTATTTKIDLNGIYNITNTTITDADLFTIPTTTAASVFANGGFYGWDSGSQEKKELKPKLIKTIGRKTFVYWKDGSYTKVTCEKDQKPDPFSAFCIAYMKKLLGSTTAILNMIEASDEKILRKKKKQENIKAHEERRKKEREAFDKEVEKKRHELAVLRAAEKLLNKPSQK